MRVERIGKATLYLADCREVLPALSRVSAMITDPVWPNCPAELIPGWDRPYELLTESMAALPDGLRQIVLVMRNDSDPRILSAVPPAYPFQQLAWLQYVMPSYLGRVLGGNECAYVFGQPVASAPGQTHICDDCIIVGLRAAKDFVDTSLSQLGGCP